ncbi:MAG: molybdopterin-dependent oxidoreductase, partial [Acidimicrobiales bacterium]|nr:molybdopterin-dependent oxidoreductase [Acidimicrobiales bacterium]
NTMARGKVYYEGHPVAAVAATSREAARAGAAAVEVQYELLPHVLDVGQAMAPGAVLLHEDMITAGVDPAPTEPSNVAKRNVLQRGDLDKGFAEADVVIERRFTTKPVHQGYIEPHACVADTTPDGRSTLWVSSQGHFDMRDLSAEVLGWDITRIKAIPAEIGGGFGGKTVTYLEPLAIALSAKAGRPVKLVMSRA